MSATSFLGCGAALPDMKAVTPVSFRQLFGDDMNANELEGLSHYEAPPLSQEEGLGALTLPGFLAEIAGRYSDREALCWRDDTGHTQRWTYGDLLAQSRRVAAALLAQGIGRGSRVGVLVSNRPEWLFSMFGAAIAGAVTVSMNTFSTRQELAYQLQHADVQLLIMERQVASQDFVSDLVALCPPLAAEAGPLRVEELPFLRQIVCIDGETGYPGIRSWQSFLEDGETITPALLEATAAASSQVDPALIFFSSGSTALPKAIQQSHRAAALQCWRFGRWFEVDRDVRTWSANGFFWSGNFAMAFGCALSVGGCLVLQRYFQPDEALQLFAMERVSQILAWPHQEARLLECPGWAEADLSSLIYVDRDSPLASHPTVNTSWRQPNGYGLTETFTFVTGIAGSLNKSGLHGFVLPGNTLRIVDPDTDQPVPWGHSGEILIKGPTLMQGYLKIPPEDVFDRNGFIHTGDAGSLTPDGELNWTGRLSDIIKTGGANVSPAEIDAVLVEHPAIQSVFTVGVPHPTLGELVVSCVLLYEGEQLDTDALKAFARESLASYKVPREVLFFREEELPMTGSNKIRRPELRKLAAQRLGLD